MVVPDHCAFRKSLRKPDPIIQKPTVPETYPSNVRESLQDNEELESKMNPLSEVKISHETSSKSFDYVPSNPLQIAESVQNPLNLSENHSFPVDRAQVQNGEKSKVTTPLHMRKLPKHLREEWVVNPNLLSKDKNIPVTPNLQAFYPQVPYYPQVPCYYVSALQPLPINQF